MYYLTTHNQTSTVFFIHDFCTLFSRVTNVFVSGYTNTNNIPQEYQHQNDRFSNISIFFTPRKLYN